MPKKETIRLDSLPASKDIGSCAACFTKNTDTPVYELRVGRAVMRLCKNCLGNLEGLLGVTLQSDATIIKKG